MDFTTVDIILLVILGLAFIYGWFAGFIKIIGNIIGLVLGIVVAGWYYQGLTTWGIAYLPEYVKPFEGVIEIIAFLLIVVVFNKATGLIFEAINQAFQLIPIVGSVNRLLGAILSVVEIVLVLTILLFVLGRYSSFIPDSYQQQIQSSAVANRLVAIGNSLEPLYPDLLAKLPSVFNKQ
ncbi:MAG: CvpA family protein [bacterium]